MTLGLRPEPAVPDLVGWWPLVGRTEHLARVIAHLTEGPSAVVVTAGAAGVGKSRLVSEALRAIEGQGVSVARVTATHSASSIPFGALAPLLPVDDLLADSVVGLLQRAARSIAERGHGGPVVLAVDDAHLLDEASATLIHQLARDGAVRLLLAIRTGEHLCASLAGVVTDPSTETIELRELSRREVAALTVDVLGGEVDGGVVHAIWDASRGNPLYVRELVVASVEDGSIAAEDGVWRLVSRPTVPARLAELIEGRLSTVTDDERGALELLAVSQSIGREALERLCGAAMVNVLVQRGLVVVLRDGRRQPASLHHPLYEETLRKRMSGRRLRATQLRLAELVEGAGMRRRDDRLLVTTLHLDAGGPLDLELLEAAALDAYFALDIELTERLARAAVASGAGARLRRILSEILRFQGRPDEAEAILGAIATGGIDDRERVLVATVRAENIFRGLGDHEVASRVLLEAQQHVRDPAWRDELTAMGAVFAALSGDIRTALATASEIIDRGPSRAMTIASTAAVAALTMGGRADDATAIAERAFRVASEFAPQESLAIAATHVMEGCLGLVEAGRIEQATSVAQMSYDWSVASGHQLGQAWFALLLGRSAQTAGRLEESARRYRESARVFRDLRDHGIRRWALAGSAQVTASMGRADLASIYLDELDTAPPTAVHLLEAEVFRARAWLAVAQGAHTRARRFLADGAEWARARGQLGLELAAVHDLIRLGDVRQGSARTLLLATEVQGPLGAARIAHAAGLHAGDAALLDDATEAFAAIGANLYAAEAAAQAAALHRRSGRDSSAAASAERSATLADLCEAACTPALGSGTSHELERLTDRELEIATLAARGLTSREIAGQLSISIRTVDNQLQRAYTKLGISSRRELAGRLNTP